MPAKKTPAVDEDIEKRFSGLQFAAQDARHQQLWAEAKRLAYVLKQKTPSSREQSLALTSLELTITWAILAISRNTEKEQSQ